MSPSTLTGMVPKSSQISNQPKKAALFIDRDGVINRMKLYSYGWDSPQSTGDITLVNGVEKIIGWANKNSIEVIEISNQPGVAKGKMTRKTSDEIEKGVHSLLKNHNIYINHKYFCYHHPEAKVKKYKKLCDCRKPKPGLLLKAAEDLKIDIKNSIFLGDNASDAEAGITAGCKTIIFSHKEDNPKKVTASLKAECNYRIFDLSEGLKILEKHFKLIKQV